ncbi:hypothetical protein P775_15895 [Puniceibacterium antarcticum]|uniref:Uncharacterized protein n=1 Tax=Puniceibacterium antarcticum TaxID=1206336 RepID=A0A2G8RC93_9RHOB|nr:hypothetical protein P775_15895 [Puniceibacterium antarcticum]
MFRPDVDVFERYGIKFSVLFGMWLTGSVIPKISAL